MARRRNLTTQVITDEVSLSALVIVMQERILEWEKEIVDKREGIIRYENLISGIKIEKKYVQTY